MTLPQVLGVLILASAMGSVLSCGGGSPPPPCSWTTCIHDWRDDWAPGVSPGRCVNQRRNAHHICNTHHGSGSCPAPSPCSPQTQYRMKCSCKNAYDCQFYDWSAWSGSIAQGSCGRQSRYRDYNEKVRYDIRDNNCNGIPSSCGSRQYNYRDWCSCKHAQCSPGSWSAWAKVSSPSNHDCVHQRTRSYSVTWSYIYKQDNCNGVSSQAPACPPADVENKNCEPSINIGSLFKRKN